MRRKRRKAPDQPEAERAAGFTGWLQSMQADQQRLANIVIYARECRRLGNRISPAAILDLAGAPDEPQQELPDPYADPLTGCLPVTAQSPDQVS